MFPLLMWCSPFCNHIFEYISLSLSTTGLRCSLTACVGIKSRVSLWLTKRAVSLFLMIPMLLTRQIIKDYKLFMVVGVLVAIDVVMLTAWQILDPFYRETSQGVPLVCFSQLLTPDFSLSSSSSSTSSSLGERDSSLDETLFSGWLLRVPANHNYCLLLCLSYYFCSVEHQIRLHWPYCCWSLFSWSTVFCVVVELHETLQDSVDRSIDPDLFTLK